MSHMDFSSSFKSVSNAMSSSFSSGSGGGGGFSGGGGRRRRPVVEEEEGKTSSFSLHILRLGRPFFENLHSLKMHLQKKKLLIN